MKLKLDTAFEQISKIENQVSYLVIYASDWELHSGLHWPNVAKCKK
jgi:hypothetical protein